MIAPAPSSRVAPETTPTIQGAESVRAAVARIRAMRRVRPSSGGSGAYSSSMTGPSRMGGARGADDQHQDRDEQEQQEHRDDGGLPAEQDRRPGDVGAVAHARAAGSVEPVGDALGHPAGHHAAEGAGEHRDRGAAESVQDGARFGGAPVEVTGDQGEGDDEESLAEGEEAEGGLAGQAARGLPVGARPGGVHDGEAEQGERGAGQVGDEGGVQPGVAGPFAAAPAADDPDDDERAQGDAALDGRAEDLGHRAVRAPVVSRGGAG